jgi:DNA-binding CsgD family transcriptional regulator
MLSRRTLNIGPVQPKTYPLGEKHDVSYTNPALALVALSHTPIEQRIYAAMLAAVDAMGEDKLFTARNLLLLTNIRSLTTIRRGLEGLLVKLSIDRARVNGNGKPNNGNSYRVYTPHQVLNRRKEAGTTIGGYFWGTNATAAVNHSFERAIARVAENSALSRREAQVALCSVEGLTNAEIGKRLNVREQTVKFHLRHVFIKFGVKRRAELISRLLM